MKKIEEVLKGLLLCLAIAIPSELLGTLFPVVGGAVFAIIAGMIVTLIIPDKTAFQPGIAFVSKKILNLSVIVETGRQSLPIIISTITISLIIAWLIHKIMHVPANISTLIGIGSSICGGSAIAAAAPVIDADDDEVAQAISVIFFYNMLAALIFPQLGHLIGFPTNSGELFGIFAGTAVNDTSSVTATASTWDSMWNLGSMTLDKAVTVKLTRTLAIIPITLVLSLIRMRKSNKADNTFQFKKIFPMFIVYFILASIITTIALSLGAPADMFTPMKRLSKFMIVLAMSAIGLNTNVIKLIKTGAKPLLLGLCCWISITVMSLIWLYPKF